MQEKNMGFQATFCFQHYGVTAGVFSEGSILDLQIHAVLYKYFQQCIFRQAGQDTAEELRGRDFRKDLEERERLAARERNKEKGSRYTSEQPKRPRLDQPPPSNLDADDPVDDDDDDDSEER